MSEHPKCFSYVMSSKDFIKSLSITQSCCKICEIKEKCVAAYNDRVYNVWSDEWFEGREDDEGWEDIE